MNTTQLLIKFRERLRNSPRVGRNHVLVSDLRYGDLVDLNESVRWSFIHTDWDTETAVTANEISRGNYLFIQEVKEERYNGAILYRVVVANHGFSFLVPGDMSVYKP